MNTLTPDQIRAYSTILCADPNYELRKKAALALAKSNDPLSIDELANLALRGGDEDLQTIARDALREIMGEEDLAVYLDEYRKANEIDETEEDELDEVDETTSYQASAIPQTGSGGPKDVGCLPWAVISLLLIWLMFTIL